jgi:hypothetical protein
MVKSGWFTKPNKLFVRTKKKWLKVSPNLLVYSLSLHRHSYVSFILAFASSIRNKQTYIETLLIKQLFFLFRVAKNKNFTSVATGYSYTGFILAFASSIHNKQRYGPGPRSRSTWWPQMRPPHNGVFWGVRKWSVRSGWDRSGPGGLTCGIFILVLSPKHFYRSQQKTREYRNPN